jgi:hypothetical protein
MNKLFPVILGLVILSGTAVMADEPAAKETKTPPAKTAAKKVVKTKAAKKVKETKKEAAPAADAKAPAADAKK